MPKEFKYSSQNNSNLFTSQLGYVTAIHQLAASRNITRHAVTDYYFSDPNDQLLYEVLLSKMQSRSDALRYRNQFQQQFHSIYDTPYDQKYSYQFSDFWKHNLKHRYKRLSRSLYKQKKQFYRNVFFNKPFTKYWYGYIDYQYKYDTRGNKWRKYRVDNNNNFINYIDE